MGKGRDEEARGKEEERERWVGKNENKELYQLEGE